MTDTAVIDHVKVEYDGGVLVADVAAEGTVLLLDSIVDYHDDDEEDAGGGTVRLNDVDYTYQGVNVDVGAETITIDSPLLEDALVSDRVYTLDGKGNPEAVRFAVVDVGDGGDLKDAVVDLTFSDWFPEGDDLHGQTVGVKYEGGTWFVTSRPDQEALSDGSTIDPDTLPQTPSDWLAMEAAPTGVQGWDSVAVTGVASFPDAFHGGCWDSGFFYFAQDGNDICRVPDAGGAVETLTSIASATVTSLTRLGSSWYVMLRDAADEWQVYIYNTSWVKTGEWLYSAADLVYFPAIGNNGTNLLTCRSTGSATTIRVRTPATGVQVGGTITLDYDVDFDVSSVEVGSFDYGASRYVVAAGLVYVFNSSGTRQSTEEWPLASAEFSAMVWDGTNFRSLGANDLYTHSLDKWTDPALSARRVGGTWTNGTQETDLSPYLTYTAKKRAQITVTFPAIPDGSTDVKVYMGQGAVTDPVEDGFWLQAESADPVVLVENPVFSGTNPPLVNDFIPQLIQDPTGQWHVSIEGDANLRNLTLEPTTGLGAYAEIGRTSGTQNMTTGDSLEVEFPHLVEESLSTFGDTANDRLVIPAPGLYLIQAGLDWGDGDADGVRDLRLTLNGSTLKTDRRKASGAATSANNISKTKRLAAGDLVTAVGFQNSGSTLTLAAGCYLSALRVG